MKPELLIHPLPETVAPADMAGGVVVVIDVLRATTVIVHALAHQARAVVPTGSVEDAWKAAERWPSGDRLLGGERHGVRIEGFDLDNSPASYTAERVAGKTIVFTTTNGTRALYWATAAAEIRIGAFSNLTALVNSLRDDPRPVHLLCAGTDRRLSAEDLLLAGAIAEQLQATKTISCETRIFQEFWRLHGGEPATRLRTMRESAGGRNLVELRFDHDIERASQIDLFSVVPIWNPKTGELTTRTK